MHKTEESTMEFLGLKAIVTGGASGIGLAIAHTLQARGASVTVLDLTPEHAPESLPAIKCDVANAASVEAAVGAAVLAMGGVDIVINNAGIGAQGSVESNSDEDWHRVFDLNVVGMVRVSRAALPHLRESEHAVIVNTCSAVATVGVPQRALYSATKGAVLSLTLAMAADHLAEGIRVNCVSPGTADTPWIDRLMSSAADPVAERAALEARQPTGRLVSADEVAFTVAYLASPHAGSTTGVNLAVDGGLQELRLRTAS
jgi:2-keto-3-deoxy-L-fuconate dehydrogenase